MSLLHLYTLCFPEDGTQGLMPAEEALYTITELLQALATTALFILRQGLKDKTELEDPNGRVRGRTEETEEDGNPIGRQTISTNLDSCMFPVTKSPTKKHK